MERYIALDVHAESTTCAVVGPTGKRLRLEVVETNGSALVECIRSIKGERHLIFEEGTQSLWLYELLEPLVEELVVAAPVKRPDRKSDAADAWGWAERLRTGAVDRRVFKRPEAFAELRQAVRDYIWSTGDEVRTKNRLKAMFRSRGLHRTGDDLYESETRTPWLAQLPGANQRTAARLGRQLDAQLAQHREVEARLINEANRQAAVKLVATAPGIAHVRAAIIVAVAVTPHRFRTKRQWWSYCGFGVITHSSSDWIRENDRWRRAEVNQTRGLNRNRHPWLKDVFKGAATTVIAKLPNHHLTQHYARLLEAGTKPNLAVLTIARRIAAAVLAMWKHEEVYDSAKHQAERA